MKAVVLAGGYGTRLRPLTYTTPKTMLPICDKPVLHYIIDFLSKQGFDEIIITTNYLENQIKNYFGDGRDFGVKIYYPKEDEPLGTAGSVKNAEKYLDETFGVIQSDNITEISLAEALRYHRERKGLATISLVSVENPWQFGIAEVNRKSQIKRFIEKPKPDECFSNLASTGLYILEPEILEYIPENTPFDFAKDLFPMMLKKGKRIYGYRAECFWVDVGKPEGYMKASEWVVNQIKRYISETAEIEGKIRGPVHIGENTVIKKGTKIEGPVIIENDCTIEADSKIQPCSVVKSGVTIGSGTKIEKAVTYQNSKIDSNARLQECIIAENCELGNNVEIGKLAVVGPNCKIADYTTVLPGSRIWPDLWIEGQIDGIVRTKK
ncbi:MAG: sugar phosphate nucleotidyltransferase [Candidatus Jordarchaeum sp.]|uniref:sugar phosphate nucleotidyltransferase n=1 Tax=Candidatus Jordarchaeum sp. TaxID=2823881 RepID=UPI00404AD9BC